MAIPIDDFVAGAGDEIMDNLSREEIPPAVNVGSKVKDSDFVPKLMYGRNPIANPDIIVGGAEHMVQAIHPQTGEVVGRMTWWEKTVANAGEIDKIDVAENYRRMGIATSMLNKAKELSQVDDNIPFPVHSATRTEMGEAWARSTGDILPKKIGEESQVAARVASNAVVQTLEEGVEKVVRHSGSTGRLLGAATEASAAVAGGINSAGALRNIGTALTVLKGRL
jgi:GNAT superfamily N-acetyltransferase